jgi:putative copper resistance protein D
VTGLEIFIRVVHYGALMLLIGSFAFLLLVARPAFRRAGGNVGADLDPFDRVLVRLAVWSLLVALLSALMWLGVEAAIFTGRPLSQALTLDIVCSALTRTQFGRVWQLRLGLLALLGGFLLFRERERDDRDWIVLRLEGVILGGGLLAALAWAGHSAATQGRAGFIHRAADSIHLLATGVWLGGLVPLFLLLTWARRSLDLSWAAVVREATRRFSALGLVCVSSLVLTGIVNAWMLVGGIPALVGTAYGRLLLLKLSLLLPLIAIAAANLLRLKPQLLAAPASDWDKKVRDLVRRLRRNVIAEACLGATILLIVGALGITPPALHSQPSWPLPYRLSWQANKYVPGVRLSLTAGGCGVLLGAAVIAYGLLRRRHRPWAIGVGLVAVGYFSVVSLRPLAVDAYPTTYLRPAVPYSALSVARGIHLYQQQCAVCHGEAGYGDGPAARGLAKRPADLTAKHTADHTAGDLFWWLSHGIKGSPMPGFQDRVSEEGRWDLINFLRALSAAEAARTIGPLPEPTPWLVAPDFTFGIGVGPGETLKDHRGWAIVHLVLFTLPGSLPRIEQLDAAWGKIGLAGARVLAVPMRDAAQIYRKLGAQAMNLPVAVDGSQEIVETYTLFRRTLATEGVAPIPSHMEFLIDRQGYIRARWIPGESPSWAEIPRLLKEIERLDKEAPRATAPEEHVH